MISNEEIIILYRDKKKFIQQICHENHAGIRRVRRVLDDAGLRKGDQIVQRQEVKE